MDAQIFNLWVRFRQQECFKMLSAKAEEYAGEVDRLENFKRAAGVAGTSLELALLGMARKHWVSIEMLAERGVRDRELWQEKITDLINYMHLLEGVLADGGWDDEVCGEEEVSPDRVGSGLGAGTPNDRAMDERRSIEPNRVVSPYDYTG